MIRYVGKPGVTDEQLTYEDYVDHSDEAFKAFMSRSPDEWPMRERELEKVLSEAYVNPAVVAVAEGSRELMTRTYAALALCRVRLNNKASGFTALAEQMRSYPELPLTRGMFGSELTEYYNTVRATESMKRLGELVIEVNQPGAQIYVNESLRGQGGKYNAKVFVGTYRVMVRVGETSLRYEITVEPPKQGEEVKPTKLELDWNLERALTASSTWVGLTLTSDDPDAEEFADVHALVRKMSGVSSLVVFNVDESGRWATAALYDHLVIESGKPAGKLVRRGRAEIKGDDGDDKRLDALALFVMKGTPSPEIVDTTNIRRGAKFAPKPQTPSQPRVAQRKRSKLPFILMGAGALAVIAGGTLYALDEDAVTSVTSERQHRDLAPLGVTVGAAGLISIGVGAVLWRRGARSTPTIALGPSSAMIGWAASF